MVYARKAGSPLSAHELLLRVGIWIAVGRVVHGVSGFVIGVVDALAGLFQRAVAEIFFASGRFFDRGIHVLAGLFGAAAITTSDDAHQQAHARAGRNQNALPVLFSITREETAKLAPSSRRGTDCFGGRARL